MKTLNALKQDMYSHIIKSDHEVGDAKSLLSEDFERYALAWIRYRLMIELNPKLFQDTTGSVYKFKSKNFEELLYDKKCTMGAASVLEANIIESYKNHPQNLYNDIVDIYIGGREKPYGKKRFKDIYMSFLDEEAKETQQAHIDRFDLFFQREDPGAYDKTVFSQENDYFVDFI